jgi:hypothetical protein
LTGSTSSGARGLTPTNPGLEILRAIHHDGPLGLQSNYARANDTAIAFLASTGLITSACADGNPTRQWRLTPFALRVITMEKL